MFGMQQKGKVTSVFLTGPYILTLSPNLGKTQLTPLATQKFSPKITWFRGNVSRRLNLFYFSPIVLLGD